MIWLLAASYTLIVASPKIKLYLLFQIQLHSINIVIYVLSS